MDTDLMAPGAQEAHDTCPQCAQVVNADDDRVAAGMKCITCAYGGILHAR